MPYLETGKIGTPLRKIIEILGEQDYPCIMVRTLWTEENKEYDELFGYCKYENGELISLDGDYYSLDDLYIKWQFDMDKDGYNYFTVWQQGELNYTN